MEHGESVFSHPMPATDVQFVVDVDGQQRLFGSFSFLIRIDGGFMAGSTNSPRRDHL